MSIEITPANNEIVVSFGGQPINLTIGENTALAKAAADRAEAAAEAAQDWAEGTGEPGGTGTKSAKAWAETVEGQAVTLNAIDAILVDVTSNNLFDPDTGVPNSNFNANGATYAGPSDWDYARIGFSVTAGQQYTITVPTGWKLNQTNYVNFYSSATTFSAGTRISSSGPGVDGVTFSGGGTQVTFTVPAGAVYVGVNAYKSPTVTADQEAMFESIMANAGATALPFEAYVAPGAKDFPDTVKNPLGTVSALVSSGVLYVRAPDWKDTSKERIWEFDWTNRTRDTTGNGTVQMSGLGIGDTSTGTNLASAFAATTAVAENNGDNAPPQRFNDRFLGGNHGPPDFCVLTATAHGLVTADLGRTATISGTNYIVARIDDANTFAIHEANTGTEDRPIFADSAPATSGTVTVNAVDIAYSARTIIQWFPITQRHTKKIIVDGNEVSDAASLVSGDKIELHETYGIPSIGAYLAYLQSTIGSATRRALDDDANETSVWISNRWTINRYGSLVGNSLAILEDSLRMGSGDYFTGWQQQAIASVGGSLGQYIAGLSGAVEGFDFHIGDSIASGLPGQIDIRSTDAADGSRKVNIFTQYRIDSGVKGTAVDIGTPGFQGETRDALSRIYRLTSSRKQYPASADAGSLGASTTAGRVVESFFVVGGHDVANGTELASTAFVAPGGITYRLAGFSTAQVATFIAMPSDTIGRRGEIVAADSHSSFTLHRSGLIDESGLQVSCDAGAHAYIKVVD